MKRWLAPLRFAGNVLADPVQALRTAAREPHPLAIALVVLALTILLGAATLPRQLALLAESLAPRGDLVRDSHHAAMWEGLVRLVVADRLVPPPTFLLSAVVLAVAAEPVLALSKVHRPAIWAVVLIGLAPMVALRLGELTVTYLVPLPAPRPGDAISLPRQFTTGPLLLWRSAAAPPAWLTSLSQYASLLTVWSVGLWAMGLRELDGRRLAGWHVALPLACLGFAAFASWWLGPMAASLLLGSP